MRHFNCHYFRLEGGILIKNENISCWNGLRHNYYWPQDRSNPEFIYIDEYIEKEILDKHRRKVVNIINKITPCKFEKIDNKIYIKYKLLRYYQSDLLLLNIIRMLWYKPGCFNLNQYYLDIHKQMRQKDPLQFMMEIIKRNTLLEKPKGSYERYDDHSCIVLNIKPKLKKDLLNYKGETMSTFLTM